MKIRFIPTISFLMLALGASAFGQTPAASNSNSSWFSSDLVMWSYMQQPQAEPGQTRQTPTPDPSPETQPQPTAPQPQSTPAQAGFPATIQTFSGTISKDSDSFVLQVSTAVFYKLDNAQQVQQYEGRRVRVTGTLDSAVNLIHVEKVEPLT